MCDTASSSLEKMLYQGHYLTTRKAPQTPCSCRQLIKASHAVAKVMLRYWYSRMIALHSRCWVLYMYKRHSCCFCCSTKAINNVPVPQLAF